MLPETTALKRNELCLRIKYPKITLPEKNELKINTTYLRDIDHYSPPKDKEPDLHPQEGKCNNIFDRENVEPIYLMQHYTFCEFEDTVSIFTEKTVSSHFVIKRDGEIYQFADTKVAARHAGLGSLYEGSKLNPYVANAKGKSPTVMPDKMNVISIGIENVNNGNEQFEEELIKSNILLCQFLSEQCPSLDVKKMHGHSDWAPGRKIDIGPYFPWEALAKASKIYEHEGVTKDFGVYPSKVGFKSNPNVVLAYEAPGKETKFNRDEVEEIQEKLRDCGYDIPETELGTFGKKTENSCLSFNLHFFGPEILKFNELTGLYTKLCDVYYGTNPPTIDQEALHGLSQMNENSIKALDDILNQY